MVTKDQFALIVNLLGEGLHETLVKRIGEEQKEITKGLSATKDSSIANSILAKKWDDLEALKNKIEYHRGRKKSLGVPMRYDAREIPIKSIPDEA